MSNEASPIPLTIIGIGGKAGSRTSTLARALRYHVGGSRSAIIAADDYYKRAQLDTLLLRLRKLRAQRPATIAPQIGRIIFIEGVTALALPFLRELCDATVFVDVPEAIRAERVKGEASCVDIKPHQEPPLLANSMADVFEDISAYCADITLDGASLSSLDDKMIWGAILAAISPASR